MVDSASIDVNRRARRAKTAWLDGDKLISMPLRHRPGEHVWSVLHEPSVEIGGKHVAQRKFFFRRRLLIDPLAGVTYDFCVGRPLRAPECGQSE
ncbi:hypothetical protein LP417_35495 (plasmid) [Polaromonas sp. P1-6]|nr:hypothetical protein LP417_35495 [Polaromonas sp. P1-6]